MSPVMVPVPAKSPSRRRRGRDRRGALISATGRPNRVTNTGTPALRTCSNTAKQVALNCDIGIARMERS